MNKKIKFIRRPCGGLTKRQLAVIDQLFKGELDEQAILDKYKVSHNLYKRWLANKDFADELDRRIESSFRQSALLIARYAPLAAAKLVQLTDSENQETARKACLDIISMLDASAFAKATSDKRCSIPDTRAKDEGRGTPALSVVEGMGDGRGQLSDEAASRLLAALAEQTDAERDR